MEPSELLKMAGNLRDREQQARAARELGEHKTPEAIAALGGLLHSRFAEVSMEACRSLVRIGSPQALPHLLRALPDLNVAATQIAKGAPRDEALRSDLHAAIKRISGRPAAEVCHALIGHRDERIHRIALDALASGIAPVDSHEVLLKLVRHAHRNVRFIAIRGLAQGSESRGAEAVRQCALTDEDGYVRNEATMFLLKGPMRQDLPTLLRLVDVSEGSVRANVIAAIGAIDTEEAKAASRRIESEKIPALLRRLQDGDPRDRERALSEMAPFDTAEKLQALQRAALDASPEVRRAAYLKLWALGGTHAALALGGAAQEKWPPFMQRHMFGLFEHDLLHLRRADYWSAVRAELQRVASEGQGRVQEWVRKFLIQDPWPPDLPLKIAALASADENSQNDAMVWVQFHRGKALTNIAWRLLEREDTRARFTACCECAVQVEPQRTAALLDALGDADEGVRRFAAWILWELLDLPGPPDLVPALAYRLPRVRALAASYLGRKRETRARPGLTALLADADAGVRNCATRALAEIGAKGVTRDRGAFDVRLSFAAPARQA